MASQGPYLPGTAAQDADGSDSWSNLDNIKVADTTDATCVIGDTDKGNTIRASNFGFTIPDGATINGISVEVKRYNEQTAANTLNDFNVQLAIGGSLTGDNKANLAVNWDTAYEVITYGGSSDLWGLTPTVAQINASNFGVGIQAEGNVKGEESTAHIDYVKITVTYTPSTIQFDAASNSGYQAASSSYSWSHTCTGSDRYLVVGVAMLSLAQTVSGITYNSVAMTLLGVRSSVSGACRVELWGLVAPATGSNTIAVTLTGSIASAALASSYTGVHQTSSTEGFASAQATNVGAADATVNVTTTADDDWVVDIVATDDGAITAGSGQNQRNNVTGAGGSGADSDEGPKNPAGSVTMSWTNVGALATWAIGAIALRPTTASGSTTIKNRTGVAYANIKNVSGVAMASVKNVTGVA